MVHFRRRTFLSGAALGIGLLAWPGMAQGLAAGFTHGVGSFDPVGGSVTLWTRYIGGDETRLGWEVAEDEGFGRIVKRGETVASAARDWCVKATVAGLDPGRWYWYRFTAPDLTRSESGRTKTLPGGKPDRFRMAVFSCSNLTAGWFNAYAHAAARDDIDLVLHLGDYFYEYGQGGYPAKKFELPGRLLDPPTEAYRLDDYRRRFANYRQDADLRKLHRLFPAITIWDDHEFANDAWTGGAENHQPDKEGGWFVRKAAAKQAYHEWLPMSDAPYASYDIGDLATLIRLDTRVEGRMEQLDPAAAAGEPGGLAAFHDGPWSDPKRTLLGFPQEIWFGRALKRSRARWQVVAQQIVMGTLASPKTMTADWIGPNPPDYVKRRVLGGIAATKAGLPFNMDSWGGYHMARERLLASAQAADADLIVLSGDSHNAWAFDLAHGGRPAGVEFGGHSVTSPGFEGSLRGVKPDTLAAALVAENPELKWCDTSRRGYMTVTLTRDRAMCDWHLFDTVRDRSLAMTTRSAAVARGQRRLELA